MSARYLTKSRFQLGMGCPSKLYYTRKPEYANQKLDDPLLLALAEGGFQVGELAKRYHPGGHDITSLDYEDAELETKRLLKQHDVIVFEPAIRFKNLFIRVDVLIKRGTDLELIEVKAKSYDRFDKESFFNKNGSLASSWRSYLYDVAFQDYVLKLALPNYTVRPYLMMIDKYVKCPTDGLHQKFHITRDSQNHKGVKVSSDLITEDLEPKMLIKVSVDECVKLIQSGKDSNGPADFGEEVKRLANSYQKDQKIRMPLGSRCRNCEFTASPEDLNAGAKSGYRECWSETLSWKASDFDAPNILSLWRYRKKDARIAEGRIKLQEIKKADIGVKPRKTPGLSTSERQWLQVQKVKDRDSAPWIDSKGLQSEMDAWNFPLHFIDFETTMVAIPFNKGRYPYEGIAFQFSHHTIQESGIIAHEGEYLCTLRGAFPNYDFIRALKTQLEKDDGTVFRYSAHENTFLCLIHAQLRTDSSPPQDRDELMAFIRSITRSGRKNKDTWVGKRCMVDMLELVKRYYYLPETNGSNSLKYILPATLNASPALQKKYSHPVYGAEGGIRSCNFSDWRWIQTKNGQIIDPYKLLPPVFSDAEGKTQELISENPELRDGGAAMIAYAKAQYEEMSNFEREQIFQALRKYCELDTLAMVMLYEGWQDLI